MFAGIGEVNSQTQYNRASFSIEVPPIQKKNQTKQTINGLAYMA